ncbi:glycosyltransferase family 4 protein [candidate division WOR-3 bacterium]|nr:glycosyltransferase family 4 protein [candidate division WOR-3 bacterium]
MKMLIVGGCLRCVAGDINVIKSIANSFAETDEVYIFPFLPVFQKKSFEQGSNFRIIEKKLSTEIFKYCTKNAVNWLKKFFPYLKFTPRGFAYYFITLFHRALIEREIKTINPDILHIHGTSIDALPFIEASIDNNIPFVVTVHSLCSFDQNLRLWFNKKLEKDILIRLAEHKIPITVVSSSTKDEIVRNFGIHSDAIKVIHNGVDLEKFCSQNISKNEIRDLYNIAKDKVVLLQVATLNKLKNHIAVLQAIASMDETLKEKLLYLIVGSGGEEKHLLKFVKRKGLTKYVLFTGRFQGEKLKDMYNLSDFFILPSTSEGLPLVSLEAMAAGLPIITFDDLGYVKDIYHSGCMELIHERYTEAIITTIKRAIDRNWEKKQIMDYAKSWDWESVCEKYKSCYNEAIYSVETKKISERDL